MAFFGLQILATAWASPLAPHDTLTQGPEASLGDSVAIDGNLAAVGASLEMVAGPSGFNGTVYLYAWDYDHWALTDTFDPQTLVNDPRFGYALDLDAAQGLLAAGAPTDGAGAVYVYARSGQDWLEVARIPSPDGSMGFGESLALADDGTLFVTNAAGGGWIFEEGVDGQWTVSQEIDCWRVAADGDRAACTLLDQPVVEIYERDHLDWEHAVTLAHDAADHPGNLYGASIDLYEDNLIVGLPGTGEALAYQKVDGTWLWHAGFYDHEVGIGTHFGTAVAAGDESYVVGAPCAGQATCGTAFHYIDDGSGSDWVMHELVSPTTAGGNTHFGRSVALDRGRVWVGAPGDAVGAYSTGAAYLFEVPVDPFCPSDVNDDDVVSSSELATVLSEWGPRAPGGPNGFLDANHNMAIDSGDLANVLTGWGICTRVAPWGDPVEVQP